MLEDKRMNRVHIQKCSSYNIDEVEKKLIKILEKLFDAEKLKSEYGENILIKPNILTGAKPDEAVVTHPVVVDVCAGYFIEKGFSVTIGDSPAVDSLKSASVKSGIDRVLKKYNLNYADFKNTIELNNPDGKLVKNFKIVKAYQDSDIIINIAKLKTHSQMYYTGAMKNLFGFIYNLQKSKYHFRFQERKNFASMIVDLNCLIKPQISIIDAVLSMQGEGPRNGKPYKSGFLAASKSALALDIVASSLIGYDYNNIPIISEAITRKMDGIYSIDDIDLDGKKLEDYECKNFKKIDAVKDIAMFKNIIPGFLYETCRKFLIPRPFFSKEKCKLCMNCVEICSADALKIVNERYIGIDYDKCIRCYCCGEVCPHDAIDIRKKVF